MQTVTDVVLAAIDCERQRQLKKWGNPSHPSCNVVGNASTTIEAREVTMHQAQNRCDLNAELGTLAWEDIVQEEWREALVEASKGNHEELRTELIQVATVVVAWIEQLDRDRSVEGFEE